MYNPQEKQKVVLSLLDKLTDEEPHLQTDSLSHSGRSLQVFRDGIKRDLIFLLNSSLFWEKLEEDYPYLRKSILNFGIPEYSNVPIGTQSEKQGFMADIEAALLNFEPRFQSVKVEIIENSLAQDRTFRFRIDAMVHADPDPEMVIFDALVEPMGQSLSLIEVDSV